MKYFLYFCLVIASEMRGSNAELDSSLLLIARKTSLLQYWHTKYDCVHRNIVATVNLGCPLNLKVR